MKKRIKINYWLLSAVVVALLSGGLLVHDMFMYAIIPFFSGKFYTLTYLGLFIELNAILLLDCSIQFIVESIEKER